MALNSLHNYYYYYYYLFIITSCSFQFLKRGIKLWDPHGKSNGEREPPKWKPRQKEPTETLGSTTTTHLIQWEST